TDPRDDGPVVGSALALLDGAEVKDMASLPYVGGRPIKVEGLAVIDRSSSGLRILATVDADDTKAPSLVVRLRVHW
ncbi:MAG: DUF6910 family protein, partial [Nocardioidaceae bacterium]